MNKNSIPNETLSPFITSGIRIGTAAITTRDFTESDCYKIGKNITKIAHNIKHEKVIKKIKDESLQILRQHPLY